VDGVYELALTVSDGVRTNVDTVRISAASPAAINVPPNVNAGNDQNVLVNTTANQTGTATDPDNGPGALTLTWTFVAPLPAGSTLNDANINNTSTLAPSFTPDVVGAYTLRLSANDGAATSTDDVVITAANNVAPNANAGADIVVPLGVGAILNGTASNDPDNRPSPLTYQWSFVSLAAGSGLTNANINNSVTAVASFTPDVLGLYLLSLDVSDGALSGNDQAQVKANVAPVTTNDSFTTAVNTALNQAAPGVLGNDTDGNSDPLTAVVDTQPAHGTLTFNTDGSFIYTPTTDFVSPRDDTFTYHANDGSVNGNPPVPVGNDNSNVATVTITVKPPNAAPSFSKGPDQTVLEDAVAQTVAGWATAIDDGDATVTQALTFNVSNNNSALFTAQPAISPSGALTYTPAANANGTATVTVSLKDNDGTTNGGIDTSVPQTFTITVTAVNDRPSFAKRGDQTVNEDSGAQTVAGWATSISADPSYESSQTLTFNVAGNTNPTLFSSAPAISSDGTLTYTPAANANGTATVTVTLSDNGGVATSATQTFTITVNGINDAPVFTPGGNVTVNKDAGAQSTVWASGVSAGAANEAGQNLLFSVSNTNAGLFSVQPAVSAIGILTFTPAANANGSATVTVNLVR
jgi:VCBS repeat-containing protein